jgi:hypothetical protein
MLHLAVLKKHTYISDVFTVVNITTIITRVEGVKISETLVTFYHNIRRNIP